MEETLKWHELSPDQELHILTAHAISLKTTIAHMRRLFEIGQPKVVFGDDPEPYCRVHADSVDVMKVITQNYLDKR